MKFRYCAVVSLLSITIGLAMGQYGKAGDCPPPTGVGVCTRTCYLDEQCESVYKCCPTACGGTFCTMPVTMRRDNSRTEKAGSCPLRPTGPWVCSSTCVYDSDCRGRHKCCRNRCGAMACSKPL